MYVRKWEVDTIIILLILVGVHVHVHEHCSMWATLAGDEDSIIM